MTKRVGNADLYIGVVRKRKSLPRDSRGFEPIDVYLKEVEEDLNRESSSSDSGEETDVEGEKQREVQAWELKRRAREQERERAEEAGRLAEERERQQTMAEAQENEPKKDGVVQKRRKSRSRQIGSRRSLRLKGMSSDTDDHESSQSATDTEMAPPSTAAGEGSDLQTGSEREGGEERDRGKKKETTSKRGRPRGRPRKSTTTLVSVARAESERKGREEEEEGVREQVTRPVSSGDSGQEGERSEGDGGHVDGANLYSPDVDVTSPSRDTIKVGPVRLTFSTSPSDDERRRRNSSKVIKDQLKSRKRSLTTPPPPTETTSAATSRNGTDHSEESDTGREGPAVRESTFSRNLSFNPKKISTQVKGGKRGRKPSTKKRLLTGGGASRRGLGSGSEENDTGDEEDVELRTLLNPSTHTSRLVGLSRLSQTRGRGTGPALEGDGSTDEDHIPPGNTTARDKSVSRHKSAIRATGDPSGKEKKKVSRKSVVFNPHTTNLGSPELAPPLPATVASAEERETGGNSAAVYDNIPSDEEDYSHSKSRLYSPRRKTILRKVASHKSKSGQRREEEEESGGGEKRGEEVRQEVDTGRGISIRELSVQVEDIGGQWFVPEELNIHKMISENSPRSLRRLTRSTKRPTVSSDTDTQPVKQRRRRQRELDSTVAVEEGGGGVSRRESDKSETTDRTLAPAGNKTATKKPGRRSVKLSLPSSRKNKQKATTPVAGDGSTPAAKKARVATPEEDEGMASGGGLSFSSSEEEGERDVQDLVRSMGGRRYRRYVVEHKESKTPGVRRSQRSRVAPLQHWMNEEPEYERRRSGAMLKGVLIPLERMPKKPAKKRKEVVVGEDEMLPQPLTFTDKHGDQQTLDVVTHPSLCASTNGQGEPATKSDDLVITKLFSSPSTSCGLLEISYLGEKERSTTTTHEVFFFVLRGRVQFIVARQNFDLSTDSQIRIPAGVTYAIKNMHRGLARLYYYSHQNQTKK